MSTVYLGYLEMFINSKLDNTIKSSTGIPEIPFTSVLTFTTPVLDKGVDE